jgi:hypothetical protein
MPKNTDVSPSERDPESSPGRILTMLKRDLEEGFIVRDEEHAKAFIAGLTSVLDLLYRMEQDSRAYLLECNGLNLPLSEND